MFNSVNVDVRTADGVCDAYLAFPEQGGPHPGVVLCMDAFGLRDYLREMTEELAGHGFVVLTPNLFYRTGRTPVLDIRFPVKPEEFTAAFPKIMPLLQGYEPELAMRDMSAFLDYLLGLKQVSGRGIGLTGYCMGGRIALRAAARYPDRVGAVASFHAGRMVSDAPDSPHLELGNIRAPTYMAHADQDASMPPEQIAAVEKALKDGKVPYRAELYRGALHGFTMRDLPAYNAEAVERHWERLLGLFKCLINS
jgi:carboxymethylenebutenolidase